MLIRRLTHREAYTSGIYLRLDRDHPSISEIKVPIIRMALLVPEAALQRPYLGKQEIARRSESRKQHRMLAAFTDGQVTCGSIGAPYVGSEHNNPRTSRLSSIPYPRTHGVLGFGGLEGGCSASTPSTPLQPALCGDYQVAQVLGPPTRDHLNVNQSIAA